MFDLKDKQLEWELRAHIQRLRCLLDNPEQIISDGVEQVTEISLLADQLVGRVRGEMNVPRMGWQPIHEGLTLLVQEMDRLMRDYHLVVLHQRKTYYEEISKTHWDDGARQQARLMVNEIVAQMGQMAQY